jgi:hypothetical protein
MQAPSFYNHCIEQMTHIPDTIKNLVEYAYSGDVEARNEIAHRISQFSFNAGALTMHVGLPKESSYDLTPPIMEAFISGNYRTCLELMVHAGRTILENIEAKRVAQQVHITSLEGLGMMDITLGC